MAKSMCRDEKSVDTLVLCYNKQNRKVSTKSVILCMPQPYIKIY